MRFLLLMLATALTGMGCEKDPTLSSSTSHLVPAAAGSAAGTGVMPSVATTPGTASAPVLAVADNSVSAGNSVLADSSLSADKGRAVPARAPEIDGTAKPAESPSAATGSASLNAITAENAGDNRHANAPAPDKLAADDGNGEPMDDVDDEVVPATHKSGVDRHSKEGAVDDGRSRHPDEDSEGADIDIRQ